MPTVNFNHANLRDHQPGTWKQEEHLSTNGKWRSFLKVPHLPQHVISGNRLGKVKIHEIVSLTEIDWAGVPRCGVPVRQDGTNV